MKTPINYIKYLKRHNKCAREILAIANERSAKEIELATDRAGVRIRSMVSVVRMEIHKLRGFVRLTQLGECVLYGYLNPRHDIGDVVTEVLAYRYPHHIIILGNTYRSWAALYNAEGFYHTSNGSLESTLDHIRSFIREDGNCVSQKDLWDIYYKSQYRSKRRNLSYFYKNMTYSSLRSTRNVIESNTCGTTLDSYMTPTKGTIVKKDT
ncbi:MAG: DUF4130 domain-containing protein [Candidatus Methanofastidiosia archaeon]